MLGQVIWQKVANTVQSYLNQKNKSCAGAIWLEGSPHIEETLYWLSLLIDTNIPIVGNASQRMHGEISADGDKNIIDSVDFILSGKGMGLGCVAIQEGQIFAARELKKSDDRPGNYRAVGGHGGILGSVKHGKVECWFKPLYKHTSISEVNLSKLKDKAEFFESASKIRRRAVVRIKNSKEELIPEAIPRVHIVKYGGYSQEDEMEDPDDEVDIMSRIDKALKEEKSEDPALPKLHGFVFEGTSPYADGTRAQRKALEIAALSGLPVVRVGRADPGGMVIVNETDLTIEGNNLDANKARILLMASMLKFGRLPKAAEPRRPTSKERETIVEEIKKFQGIFDTH
jgi:L-asparaginase